jgi:hypothetical protein
LRLRIATLTATNGLTLEGKLIAFGTVSDPDTGVTVTIGGNVTTSNTALIAIDIGPVPVELKFNNFLTNNGTIELQGNEGSHSDTLTMVSGVLNNESGATIRSLGDHVINGPILNRGIVTTSGTGASLTVTPCAARSGLHPGQRQPGPWAGRHDPHRHGILLCGRQRERRSRVEKRNADAH